MDVAELRKKISAGGHVVTPEDAEYDGARKLWNAAIDKKPKVIVQCKGVVDVQTALKFAADNKLPVSVRGGGHSFSGRSVIDNGLVVDLGRMNGVRVNPKKQTAWVEGGARWEAVDRETTAHGLATVGGTVSDTGVGGLAQGGGFGFLSRLHGLVVDNILAADVVLADGRFVHATEKENSDLLWGIRGGAGNFGVVTAFKFRLHKLPEQVYGGFAIFPYAKAKELLTHLLQTHAARPAHSTLNPVLACPPPLNFQPAVVLLVAHFGPKQELDKTMADLHAIAQPLMSTVGPAHYTDIQKIVNAFAPPHMHFYATSQFLKFPPDNTYVDDILALFDARTTPGCTFVMECFGAAVLKQPADKTCFGHREKFDFQYIAWTLTPTNEGFDKGLDWIQSVKDKMVKHQYAESFYANYAVHGVDPDQQARWAFGKNLPKLQEAKKKYDPNNVFSSTIIIKV